MTKKISGLICDNDRCRRLYKDTSKMTNKDWKDLQNDKVQLCPRCEASIKLEELELARPHLNSDYYWRRKKELESLMSLISVFPSIESNMEGQLHSKYKHMGNEES